MKDGVHSARQRLPVVHVTTFPPENCGIGEVIRELVRACDGTRRTVVLANTVLGRSTQEPFVFQVWRKNDMTYPFRVLSAIRTRVGSKSAIVHVQHHFFLYGSATTLAEFPLMLFLLKIAGHRIATQLNSVVDFTMLDHDIDKLNLGISHEFIGSGLRVFYRVVAALSDRIIVWTEAMKKTLVQIYRVTSGKVIAVPLGWRISPTVRPEESKRTLSLQDTFLIVFHGFLDPTKGLENLFEAFAEIAPKIPTAKLFIVGQMSPHLDSRRKNYSAELAATVARLRLSDRILFTGYVDEDRLTLYLSAADLFVLPYATVSSAGGSAVLSKVAAFGKPLIASRISRFSEELRNGETALLVTPGSVQELAEAIESLVGDPKLAQRLGEKLRALAIERSWRRTAETLETVYTELEMIRT